MSDRFTQEPRRSWPVLLLVFLLGIAAGVLLERLLAHGPGADVLAALALVVIGLGLGGLLFAGGWLLGTGQSERPVEQSTAPAPGWPARAGEGATAAAEATAAAATAEAADEGAAGQAAADQGGGGARVPLVPALAGYGRGGFGAATAVGPVTDAGHPAGHPAGLPAGSAAAGLARVAGDDGLQVLRGPGQWALRMRNVLAYESLQITVGLRRGWGRQPGAGAGAPGVGAAAGGVMPRRPALREGAAAGGAGGAAGGGLALGNVWLTLSRAETLGVILFGVALLVYAITRFVQIDHFPIFFFTDEAIHPVLGTELAARGWKDAAGRLFPPYFQNGLYWNLSLSVYLHALTAGLFGKTIVVTRATSAVCSLLAAGALGLALKWFFKARTWWAGTLMLAATPAFFLHSRTAFETVLMVSFYAIFLLFYLLYRYRSPKYLFPTLIFAAATFYAYANGQAIIGVSGILFLLTDLRYHLKNWRTGVWGVALLVLLALPYLRFRSEHPDVVASHLRVLDSYWLVPGPVSGKISRFISTYLYGLSPAYWFFPNDHDLIRHRMKDYGNIATWAAPFVLVGLYTTLRKIKLPEYRAILIALVAAPVGTALVDVAITRDMLVVVPAALLAALGIETIVNWIKPQRIRLAATALAFILPAVLSLTMMSDALANGPTWYDNYGLYGMQWGAQQLFQLEIPKLLKAYPNVPVYVTHTWANGSDIFLRFFNVPTNRVQAITVDAWLAKKLPLDPNAVFIMAPEEYQKASTSPKFKSVDIIDALNYPNGEVGFYVGRLEYADNADAIFAEEKAALRQLVTEQITVDGQPLQIAHTRFDMGDAHTMFDGDTYTVSRGIEANPLVLDMKFPNPRAIQGLNGYFGKANVKILARLYATDTSQPVEYTFSFKFAGASTELPSGPQAQMDFPGAPATVRRLYLEVTYPDTDETAHVHVFELKLR